MIKAPYNFVPLAQKVVFPEWADQVSIDQPFEDGISGTINVKYTAQTPVFVGNGKSDNNSTIPNYKAANGKYAIPGSSLRGMLRNVMEIASFGKFNRVSNAALSVRDLTPAAKELYRSHFTNKSIKGGWLVFENTDWMLYPVGYQRVEDSEIEKQYNLKFGSLKIREDSVARIKKLHNEVKVFFSNEESKVSRIKRTSYRGSAEGFIVLTGNPGGKKHLDFIFENKSKEKISIDKNTILQFKQINASKAADQKRGLNLSKKLNEYQHIGYPGIPVFYLSDENGKPESLGLSMMYRLPYSNTIHDAIMHSSDTHFSDKMDFVECIFGKISNEKNMSLRGRVQFEDAVTDSNSLAAKVDTVLGNPKSTYYPNYIQQDVTKSKYETLMNGDVRLRGWKRYPTRNNPNPLKVENGQENVASHFSPLEKGTVFEGKIHFHNLKKEELGLLLWAITWGNDNNLSHAVGMGKSYGFGQIKADISSLSFLENTSMENIYKEASTEEKNAWIQNFELYMAEKVVGWNICPQLVELKAMANPKNAERPKWDLSHLKLKDQNNKNEFVEAKKQFYFLSSYSKDNQESKLSNTTSGFNNQQRYQNNHDFVNKRQPLPQQKVARSESGVANNSIQNCILLEEKTKKGGWKAVVKDVPEISGPIINSGEVPSDKNPGDEIQLKVNAVQGNNTSFRYENK